MQLIFLAHSTTSAIWIFWFLLRFSSAASPSVQHGSSSAARSASFLHPFPSPSSLTSLSSFSLCQPDPSESLLDQPLPQPLCSGPLSRGQRLKRSHSWFCRSEKMKKIHDAALMLGLDAPLDAIPYYYLLYYNITKLCLSLISSFQSWLLPYT